MILIQSDKQSVVLASHPKLKSVRSVILLTLRDNNSFIDLTEPVLQVALYTTPTFYQTIRVIYFNTNTPRLSNRISVTLIINSLLRGSCLKNYVPVPSLLLMRQFNTIVCWHITGKGSSKGCRVCVLFNCPRVLTFINKRYTKSRLTVCRYSMTQKSQNSRLRTF